MKQGTGLMIGLLIIIIVLVTTLVGVRSYELKCQELEQAIETEKQAAVTNYEEMWASFKTEAGLTDEQADPYEDLYTGLINTTYNDDTNLFSLIMDDNPKLTGDDKERLQSIIAEDRKSYHLSQLSIVSTESKYNKFVVSKPMYQSILGKEEVPYSVENIGMITD